MKRIFSLMVIMLSLVIAAPVYGAQKKHSSKHRSNSTRSHSSKSTSSTEITWIGDIPSPKCLLRQSLIGGDTQQERLIQALKDNGYLKTYEQYEPYYTLEYSNPEGITIKFMENSRACGVGVTIPNSLMRRQYLDAVRKAYGSNRKYYINTNGDEVSFCFDFDYWPNF